MGYYHHNLLRTPFPSVSIITDKARPVEEDCTYVAETVLLGREDTLHILLFQLCLKKLSLHLCVYNRIHIRYMRLKLNYETVNSEVFYNLATLNK